LQSSRNDIRVKLIVKKPKGDVRPFARWIVVLECNHKLANGGLQLRRAISIQAEGKKLLGKHAVAPSAARLCWMPPLN